jgi:hypothetical protein
MNNAIFWDIKNQFVSHRRHITSPLQSPRRLMICKICDFHGDDYEEVHLNNVIRSSETSALTRATRRNITEDGIFNRSSVIL